MAITPNFSCSQNYGEIPTLSIEDTSTGTEATLTTRLIYLRKHDGTYLVPSGYSTDYIPWAIGNTTLDIEDVLDKDYCLDITVKWLTGSTVTHTKTILNLFKAYSELFLRQLTQYQAANPNLISNKNFWTNKCKLRTLVDDAEQAVEVLNDQTIATYALAEAKVLTDNPELFY